MDKGAHSTHTESTLGMSTQCLSTVPNNHEQALNDGINAGSPFPGGAMYTHPTAIAHQSASANGYTRLGGNTIA